MVLLNNQYFILISVGYMNQVGYNNTQNINISWHGNWWYMVGCGTWLDSMMHYVQIIMVAYNITGGWGTEKRVLVHVCTQCGHKASRRGTRRNETSSARWGATLVRGLLSEICVTKEIGSTLWKEAPEQFGWAVAGVGATFLPDSRGLYSTPALWEC